MSAASRMLALACDCESNAKLEIELELAAYDLAGIAADIRELAAAEARGIAVGRQAERERIAQAMDGAASQSQGKAAETSDEVERSVYERDAKMMRGFAVAVRAFPHEPIKGDEGRGS